MDRRQFIGASLQSAGVGGLGVLFGAAAAPSASSFARDEGRFELGDFTLQSGVVLKNAYLAYETHGHLDAARANAIVYPTWYAGTHVANRAAIGPGRALDPDRFFIIVPDMFCNGLSSSPSNSSPPQHRSRFPLLTPYDNVIAQERLCREVFGLTSLELVVGFSMSAQQAFHWAALYPDAVRRMAAICGTAKTTSHNWLFLEGVKLALQADEAWAGGDYTAPPTKGLRAFSTVYASWAASQQYFAEGLHLSFAGQQLESMESFLDAVYAFFSQFDANDLLGMLATWQAGDVGRHPKFPGGLAQALGAIRCPAMVMPSRTDLYFTPRDSEIEVSMMQNAELRIIPSIYGHQAGLPGVAPPKEEEFVDRGLRDLLSS